MPATLLEVHPDYQVSKKALRESEKRLHLRRVREFAAATRFQVACHLPSRRLSIGRTWKGTRATFTEVDQTKPLPGVRLRPLASGAEASAGAPGLVSKEKTEQLKGQRGMTPQAVRWLEQQLWTLSGFRRRLSFWTVTLPDDALRQLHGIESGWQRFSARLHKQLTRRLKQAGVIPWWASVTEIQTKRSRGLRMPAPHLHITFVGRPARCSRGGWYLSPEVLDEIIATSLESAGVVLPEGETARRLYLRAAGQVQEVKKDVSKYMAKYVTKDAGSVSGWNAPAVAGGLYVNQWWHSSTPLKNRGRAHQPLLHGEFGHWCRAKQGQLEQLGVMTVSEFEAEDFRPAGFTIKALRRDGIELAWRIWAGVCFEASPSDKEFIPHFVSSRGEWGRYPYEDGAPSLSGRVVVSPGCDVVPVAVSVVPSRKGETNHAQSVMDDRINSPVLDVVKERLELLYRKVHVAEPVFPGAGVLGVQGELDLPGDLGAGSGWDVGPAESFDPFWDDPGWRGGPPR